MPGTNAKVGVMVIASDLARMGHDLDGLVKKAMSYPSVVHAELVLLPMEKNAPPVIKDLVKDKGANRLVIASIAPVAQESLTQVVIGEGLRFQDIVFVDLTPRIAETRLDGRTDPEVERSLEAGVAKARFLLPSALIEREIGKGIVVVGGGISGMTAALSLADQGYSVTLVEKEDELGGYVRNLFTLFPDGSPADQVLEDFRGKVKAKGNIKVHTGTKVKAMDGTIGSYELILESRGSQTKIKAGAIVLATGARSMLPEGLYGFGTSDRILTLTQFETLVKEKKLPPDVNRIAFIQCTGARGQRVDYCSRVCCNASIEAALDIALNRGGILGDMAGGGDAPSEEDAGGEERQRGRQRRARRARPGREAPSGGPGATASRKVEMTIFNKSISTYGVDYELNFNRSRSMRVRFARFSSDDIPSVSEEGGKIIIDYHQMATQSDSRLEVDLLVLAVPIVPSRDTDEISRIFRIPIGEDGFLQEINQEISPVQVFPHGIFMCGTVSGPVSISESIAQALSAASKVSNLMRAGKYVNRFIYAVIDHERCDHCGDCEDACPRKAIVGTATGKYRVKVELCNGNGLCSLACPKGAITFRNYNDPVIKQEIQRSF